MSKTSYFSKVALVDNNTKIFYSFHINRYLDRNLEQTIARNIHESFLLDLRILED